MATKTMNLKQNLINGHTTSHLHEYEAGLLRNIQRIWT